MTPSEEILSNISLKEKINVLNQMAFIDLLTELGYREDKMWTNDEDEILAKLCSLAEKHTENIMEEINHEKQDS